MFCQNGISDGITKLILLLQGNKPLLNVLDDERSTRMNAVPELDFAHLFRIFGPRPPLSLSLSVLSVHPIFQI